MVMSSGVSSTGIPEGVVIPIWVPVATQLAIPTQWDDIVINTNYIAVTANSWIPGTIRVMAILEWPSWVTQSYILMQVVMAYQLPILYSIKDNLRFVLSKAITSIFMQHQRVIYMNCLVKQDRYSSITNGYKFDSCKFNFTVFGTNLNTPTDDDCALWLACWNKRTFLNSW
jgi:hypothetical protein